MCPTGSIITQFTFYSNERVNRLESFACFNPVTSVTKTILLGAGFPNGLKGTFKLTTGFVGMGAGYNGPQLSRVQLATGSIVSQTFGSGGIPQGSRNAPKASSW